ncbi:MAG TPA: hypothetical protein VKB86_05870 [Pyrinomonadaceae bacterium]|nr:hypothetical protein [Pyrinomonadaceae bacterium]
MRKLFSIALLLSLSALVSVAQTTSTSSIPVTDKLGPVTFVGYSYMQADGMPPTVQSTPFNNSTFGERTGLHGMVSESTYYLTHHFGITADFSVNVHTRTFTTQGAGGQVLLNSLGTRVINLLGGPQVRFPNHTRAVPFVHALFGIANTRFLATAQQTIPGGGFFTNIFDKSGTDFAMALGGGLDVGLTGRIGLRIFQIDYNPVFLRDRSINVTGQNGAVQVQTLESNRQDNVRFGFGVLIR